MRRRSLSILLLTTLTLTVLSSIPVFAMDPDLKIVVQLKGALEADNPLNMAIEAFSNVEWQVVLEDLSASDLADADMLILIQADMSVEYTSAEKAAVKSWFETSGKTLWVCADSDYPDQYMRVNTANDMLENVESKLRAEQAEATDPTSNGGADYRVLGVSWYCDPEVSFIVDDVNKSLFHGPGSIVGYLGGSYYTLDTVSLDGVYVVMTTSSDGLIVDYEPPAPIAYEVGYEGSIPLLAMEIYANGNVVYAGADAPFSHYTPMYKPEVAKPERYGDLYPQQGATLFRNIVNFAIRTKLAANIGALEGAVSDLEDDKASLESEVSSLEGDKATLEDEVEALEADVAGLESDKAGLESTVSGLEDDLAKANSAVSSWQMYAIVALIIGVVVGYFVGPMLKK